MSLNREDVEKLCLLARLKITPEEMTDVASKLSDIVTLVNQLRTADTTEVVPMAHPLDIAQRLREDKVTESDRHEHYQQNASMVERDLYLVPKVIE
jgi:aspartyl-tRNA(Asn)/glutamyl-tRNA(Gln) amidotransferase subunit C|tara:strand:+ start:65 stop:352 length:288 start_codon:yes stop_codon:yes gene_type:complete